MELYLIAMVASGAIYALLALGLNIAWGLTGMVNLGLVGFFGVGAYASGIITVKLGLPIPVGLLAGAVVGGIAGVIVTLATLRLRGDYLAIVTLGFAELIRLIASNEVWLTGGTDGLTQIPGPWRGTLTPAGFNILYCAIALAFMAVALWIAERVRASPFGRTLRAIRDDDVVAAVAGKYVTRYRLQAFALGSAISGLGGALYAHYNAYFSPDHLLPLITINIFLALTMGGVGNNFGAVLGAFVVIAILESTRFLAEIETCLRAVQVAALREIAIGLLLLIVMRVRPNGLIPEPLPRHAGQIAKGP
jgi:branched-chain amino acid transport system permease protein